MTALPPAGFPPARGTAHASKEPLSCSLLFPLRYALRLQGLVPLKNAAWLSCAVREPTNIFKRGNHMATPNTKPATAFRSGNVNAAIWENTGEKGPFVSVSFSRPYRTRKATGRSRLPTAQRTCYPCCRSCWQGVPSPTPMIMEPGELACRGKCQSLSRAMSVATVWEKRPSPTVLTRRAFSTCC